MLQVGGLNDSKSFPMVLKSKAKGPRALVSSGTSLLGSKTVTFSLRFHVVSRLCTHSSGVSSCVSEALLSYSVANPTALGPTHVVP